MKLRRHRRDHPLAKKREDELAELEPGKLSFAQRERLATFDLWRDMGSLPGKVTLTSLIARTAAPVQMAATTGGQRDPKRVRQRAREGAAGDRGESLPYHDIIQQAFGDHPLGDVRAHIGGAAAEAARDIGARAYATGNDVVFATPPDLHTAAHEAAHVIQQRAGVHLSGGVGAAGDRYERHADAVAAAVVRGASAAPLLDQMPGGGGTPVAVQRTPERGDQARIPDSESAPTHILRGSTHRFGALMHIYESGDFGDGGLGPHTVVGAHGETLEEVYQMYRRGEIASENSHFRANHAADLVASLRAHGFVTDAAEAEALGLGGRDGIHPIRIEPAAEGQDPGPAINERLDGEGGLRSFVVNGYRTGTREGRRSRLGREAFLERVAHDGHGNWTRDGQPLDDADLQSLRAHLAENAERRGLLQGEQAARYRRYLEDPSNPPLDAASWYRAHDVPQTSDGAAPAAERQARPPQDVPQTSDGAAPDAEGQAPPRQRPQGREVVGELGADGTVSVQQHMSDGSQRGGSGRLDQHGGAIEVNRNRTGRAEDQRRVSASYHEHRNAEGEVTGRDLSAGGGRGVLSGELSGGYTFEVQPAIEQPDGSFQVSWKVSARAGASASVRGQGGGAQGNITRSGTYVASGGTREQNRAAAERYRADFGDHALREFQRAAAQQLGSVEWWRGQPAGTSRQVQIGGSLSGQASAAILGVAVGASGDVAASEAATVTRGASTTVTVTQTWDVTIGGGVNAAFVVGTSVGGEHQTKVSETFTVDLVAGEEAFSAFLAHESPLEQGQTGVTLTSRREEQRSGSRLGASVALLGEVHGGEGTGEIHQQRFDAQGHQISDDVIETGHQHQEGSSVFGDYSRRRFEVRAPETGDSYTITSNIHDTSGQGSADMLGDAAGEGRAGSRAQTSGNWIVSQGLTQAEALRFHRNLIARERPPVGSPVRDVWDRLSSVPTNDDALVARPNDPEAQHQLEQNRHQRAEAITAFLADEGDDAVRIVRSVAGNTDDTRYLRLYSNGQEDLTIVGHRSAADIEAGEDHRRRIPTFLGRTRSQQMARWIQARADGPVVPADVTEARRRMADLDARIAQIADVNRYTDLPPATRAEILARYRSYRDQLGAIIARAGDAEAEDMSGEGQEHHAALRAAQRRVARMRRAAERYRRRVVRARARFGQADSETRPEARLPARLDGRTRAMWGEAESTYQAAEDARAAADARLADSLASERTRNETDQRAAYRSAAGDLDRAEHFYQDARDAHRRLARLYARYDAYLRGELDDDRGSRRRSRRSEHDTADEAASGRRESDADEHDAERNSDGPAETPESPAVAQRLSLPASLIAPHIHPARELADIGRPAPVDRGPVTLPGGLVVTLLRARPVMLGSRQAEQVTSQFGNDASIWNVDMEIATPAPGVESYVVRAMVDVARRGGTQVVVNRAGERFVGSVVRRGSD